MFLSPMRPTFLRMAPAPGSTGSTGEQIELHVWHSKDKHGLQKAHWLTLWQVVDMLTPPGYSITKDKDRHHCFLDLWRLNDMGWTAFPPCRVVVTPVAGTTREIRHALARPKRQHAAANTQRDTRDGSNSEIEGNEDGLSEADVEGVGSDEGSPSDIDDIVAAWAEVAANSQASQLAVAQLPSLHTPGIPGESSSSKGSSSSSNGSGSSSSSSSNSSISSRSRSSCGSESEEDSEVPVDTVLPGPEEDPEEPVETGLPEEVDEPPAEQPRADAPSGREHHNKLIAAGVTVYHTPSASSVYVKCVMCGHRMTRTLTIGRRGGKGRPLGLLAAWATTPCQGRDLHRDVKPGSGPQHGLQLAKAIEHHHKHVIPKEAQLCNHFHPPRLADRTRGRLLLHDAANYVAFAALEGARREGEGSEPEVQI